MPVHRMMQRSFLDLEAQRQVDFRPPAAFTDGGEAQLDPECRIRPCRNGCPCNGHERVRMIREVFMNLVLGLFIVLYTCMGSAWATDAWADDKAPELKVAQGATLVTNGFTAGWLVGTKLWVSPLRNELSFPEYAILQGGLNDTIGPVAPYVMGGTTVVNVAPLVLIRRPKKLSFLLHSAGVLLNSGVIVTTAALNVPVNEQTKTWTADQEAPEDWEALRRQWETGHSIRATLSLAAFAANTAAVLVD